MSEGLLAFIRAQPSLLGFSSATCMSRRAAAVEVRRQGHVVQGSSARHSIATSATAFHVDSRTPLARPTHTSSMSLEPRQQRPIHRPRQQQLLDAAAPAQHHLQHQLRPVASVRMAQLQLSIQDGGSLPSAQQCNEVLAACAPSCRWDDVWRCYQCLNVLGIPIEQRTHDVLWRAALKACYVAQGVEVFRTMVAASGTHCQRSYTSIISSLLKIRRRGLSNRRLAYELWKELEAGVWGLDAASMRCGLNACVAIGNIDEAQGLMAFMRKHNMRPGHGAYNILLKYYCERGKMDDAARVVRDMSAQGYTPDIITFNTLVTGYAKQGDVDRARAVINRAKAAGCEPDVQTWSPYILALARKGDVATALVATAEMREAGVVANAWVYAALVQAFIKAGDVTGAEVIAQDMTRKAGLPPSSVVYNQLIQAHLHNGYAGEGRVQALLLEMHRVGLKLDVDTHCLLMDRRASVAEHGAEWEVVMASLQQMRSQGLAPDAVQQSTVCKVLQRAGRVQEALGASAEIASCANLEKDLVAHNQLVHVLCVSGKLEEAEKAAEVAAAYAAKHSLPAPVESFTAIVRAYYRRQQLRPMMAAFRRFLQLGGRPNVKMANAVVRLCLIKGELSAAFKAIRAMQLLGVDMDLERYKGWVMEVQAKGESQDSELAHGAPASSPWPHPQARSRSEGAAPGHDVALERLKWFLGLSNSYYQTDWREGRPGGGPGQRSRGVGGLVPHGEQSVLGDGRGRRQMQLVPEPVASMDVPSKSSIGCL